MTHLTQSYFLFLMPPLKAPGASPTIQCTTKGLDAESGVRYWLCLFW